MIAMMVGTYFYIWLYIPSRPVDPSTTGQHACRAFLEKVCIEREKRTADNMLEASTGSCHCGHC
jgi:hypothetical protein